MFSFNLVVACNNLLALKGFNTYLSNYELWEKPTFAHRWVFRRLRGWMGRKALKCFEEVRQEALQAQLSLSLNDCRTDIFALLHLALKGGGYTEASALYMDIAETELRFQSIKTPRESVKVGDGA